MGNAWRRLAGGLAAGSLILAGLAAPAATLAAGSLITVTTLSDSSAAGDGQCSLREAIIAANLNIGNTNNDCNDGQSGEPDQIQFEDVGTILLTSNLPAITDIVSVEGQFRVTVDGQDSYTPFSVISGGLDLSDIVVQDGFGAFGGAITNGASVALSRVTVRSSGATYGGGIHNNGSMTIRQSTIEGNTASNAGGGIFTESALTMYNVTIAGNSADEGGGIYLATGAMTAAHVTIARNTAATGAGIQQGTSTHTISNSLIVANVGPETSGGVGTQFSLVQGSGDGVLDPAGPGNNGGPTRTIRLVGGANPALSIGDQGWCAAANWVDQRGVARPNGATDKCDAGAVQRDRTSPVMSSPNVHLRFGVTLDGTSSRARVVFSATDTGTGIERFSLQRQVNGGSWTSISTTIPPFLLTSAGGPVAIAGLAEAGGVRNVTLTKDNSYRFRARAVDEDGNVSGWRYSPTVTAKLYQQTSSSMGYTSGWSTASSSKFSGGSVRYVRANGKAAALTFTGRSVAFVTTLRAGGTGKVWVYADGSLIAVETLSASANTYRSQVVAWSFPSSAQHKIRVVTEGAGRVDIDAFAVLR